MTGITHIMIRNRAGVDRNSGIGYLMPYFKDMPRIPQVGLSSPERNSLFGSTPSKSLEPHHQAKMTTEKKNLGVLCVKI